MHGADVSSNKEREGGKARPPTFGLTPEVIEGILSDKSKALAFGQKVLAAEDALGQKLSPESREGMLWRNLEEKTGDLAQLLSEGPKEKPKRFAQRLSSLVGEIEAHMAQVMEMAGSAAPSAAVHAPSPQPPAKSTPPLAPEPVVVESGAIGIEQNPKTYEEKITKQRALTQELRERVRALPPRALSKEQQELRAGVLRLGKGREKLLEDLRNCKKGSRERREIQRALDMLHEELLALAPTVRGSFPPISKPFPDREAGARERLARALGNAEENAAPQGARSQQVYGPGGLKQGRLEGKDAEEALRKLFEEKGILSPIHLPKDELLVSALKKKLEEYKGRMNDPRDKLDAEYKMFVLGRLLENGKVVAHSLARELREKDPNIDLLLFATAFAVINGYVTGKGNVGGTGLPDPASLPAQPQDGEAKKRLSLEEIEKLFASKTFKERLSDANIHGGLKNYQGTPFKEDQVKKILAHALEGKSSVASLPPSLKEFLKSMVPGYAPRETSPTDKERDVLELTDAMRVRGEYLGEVLPEDSEEVRMGEAWRKSLTKESSPKKPEAPTIHPPETPPTAGAPSAPATLEEIAKRVEALEKAAQASERATETKTPEDSRGWLRRLGEKYRKLPLLAKVSVAGALLGVGALGAAAGPATWFGATVVGISYAGARAVSFLGMYGALDMATEKMKNRKAAGVIRIGGGIMYGLLTPHIISELVQGTELQKYFADIAKKIGIGTGLSGAAEASMVAPDALRAEASPASVGVPPTALGPEFPIIPETVDLDMDISDMDMSPQPRASLLFGEPVTIAKGNTIWGLVEKKLEAAGELNGLDRAQKDYILDSYMKKLQALGPEKLKEMGFRTGNINQVWVGDKINLSALDDDTLKQRAFEKAHGLTNTQKQNLLKVRAEMATRISGGAVSNLGTPLSGAPAPGVAAVPGGFGSSFDAMPASADPSSAAGQGAVGPASGLESKGASSDVALRAQKLLAADMDRTLARQGFFGFGRMSGMEALARVESANAASFLGTAAPRAYPLSEDQYVRLRNLMYSLYRETGVPAEKKSVGAFLKEAYEARVARGK